MTAQKRILVAAPVGTVPWVPLAAIVDAIAALGWDVVIDDPGHDSSLIGRPPVYLPGEDGWREFFAALRHLGAWLRWRRSARQALGRLDIRRVLAWDTTVVLLYRFVRPRGTKITWVLPDTRRGDRRGRLERLATLASSDTIVMRRTGETRMFASRQALAPPPHRVDVAPALGDNWIVLARNSHADKRSLAYLRGLAAQRPAAAVVVDGRRSDAVPQAVLTEIGDAAGTSRVIYAADDEWLSLVGARRGVDVGAEFVDDHRHWTLLRARCEVCVAPGVAWWEFDHRLTRTGRSDGSSLLILPATAPATSLGDWCAAAVGRPG